MARSPHYKGNNEGGYGNPPVDHQFKGQPGPGRPKGSTSLESSLKKVLSKKVVRVGKDGKRTSVDAPEALAERMLELGLKGTLSANIEARRVAEKYFGEEQQQEPDLTKFTDVELQLYGYLSYKVSGGQEEVDSRFRWIFDEIQRMLDAESRKNVEEYWSNLRKPGRTAGATRLPTCPEDESGDEYEGG